MNDYSSEQKVTASILRFCGVAFLCTLAVGACSSNAPAPSTSVPMTVIETTKNPLPDLAAAASLGKPLYLVHCAMCHGEDGKGEGMAGGSLARKPTDLTAGDVVTDPDGRLFLDVKNGIRKDGKQTMPPAKQVMDEQIWQIIAYVRTLEVR